MIVKMKKVMILVSATARHEALTRLGELGVLHVDTHLPSASGDRALDVEHRELVKALELIEDLAKLEAQRAGRTWQQKQARLGPRECAHHAVDLVREREQLSEEAAECDSQLRWYRDWGNISLASIERLNRAGISVRFLRLDEKRLKALSTELIVHVGKEVDGAKCVAMIGQIGGAEEIEQDVMPDEEAEVLNAKLEEARGRLAELDRQLAALAPQREPLRAYLAELDHQIEVDRVGTTMGLKGVIAYLEGYCPRESIEVLDQTATEQGWACIVQEPPDPEQVPVLVRTPRWLRIINPVFVFMGTTPGYREFDISFWFLISFSLFFAVLIGDAGYGSLFLVTSLLLRRRFPRAPWEPFLLLILLSAATIVWGTVSGTWFGYRPIGELPLLQPLVVEQVNSFVDGNQPFMMFLCFIVGAVHLTLARLVGAVRRINSMTALAELGWIGIIWALFFLAGNLVVGRAMPHYMPWALAAGIGLVVLFSDPRRNILKGALVTLANLPLKLVSSFSDIVSYLRLFAVGYASVVVASSFNDMALEIGFDSIATGFAAAAVLFVGHAMNVTLGIMAVIVHGIRLNMLEFSGHLGMQWSGKPYRPFGLRIEPVRRKEEE